MADQELVHFSLASLVQLLLVRLLLQLVALLLRDLLVALRGS